jgi:hypothetical protein
MRHLRLGCSHPFAVPQALRRRPSSSVRRCGSRAAFALLPLLILGGFSYHLLFERNPSIRFFTM